MEERRREAEKWHKSRERRGKDGLNSRCRGRKRMAACDCNEITSLQGVAWSDSSGSKLARIRCARSDRRNLPGLEQDTAIKHPANPKPTASDSF